MSLSEREVIERLREACRVAGNQAAFAKLHGLTPAYVGDVIHGRRQLADKILRAIGIEKVVTYRPIDSQMTRKPEDTTEGN